MAKSMKSKKANAEETQIANVQEDEQLDVVSENGTENQVSEEPQESDNSAEEEQGSENEETSQKEEESDDNNSEEFEPNSDKAEVDSEADPISSNDDVSSRDQTDPNDRSKREIYVGGLPYNIEEDQIRDIAKDHGSIQSIKICKGFAFVIFDVPESAVAAAEALNEMNFEGRVLRSNVCADRFSDKVQKSQKSREATGLAVILKNLSFDTTEETVKKSLRNCGEVLSVRIPIFHDTQKSRGWCIVEFGSEEDVNKALALGTLSVDGRTVRIERQNPSMRGGARDGGFRNKRPWSDRDGPDKRSFGGPRDGANRRDFSDRRDSRPSHGSREGHSRPYSGGSNFRGGNSSRQDRPMSSGQRSSNEFSGSRKVFD